MPQAGTSTKPIDGPAPTRVEVYSPAARTFHWLTVALLLVQLPLGFYMVWYASKTDFAEPSGTLYDSHKLIGLSILLVVLARLAYRLSAGAPPPEPTIEPWQRTASHGVHWLLYVLLLAVPLGGWLGVSYYGPVEPFGIKLPSLVGAPATDAIKEANEKYSEKVFGWHAAGAIALLSLILLHFAAALFHRIVRKDGVLTRMLPGLGDRS